MRKRIYRFALIFTVCFNSYGQELVDIRNDPPVTNLTVGDDQVSQWVQLPFTFTYYDTDFVAARMSSNGCLSFSNTACNSYNPQQLPYQDFIMYGFWTDLIIINNYAKMLYKSFDDKAVFGWYDISEYYNSSNNNTFEIILYNDNSYEYRYGNLRLLNHNILIGSQGANGQIDQRLWFDRYSQNQPDYSPIQQLSGTSLWFNVQEQEEDDTPIEQYAINEPDYSFNDIDLVDDGFPEVDTNYTADQTGYDIFESVGLSQEDIIGYTPIDTPIDQQQDQTIDILNDSFIDIPDATIDGFILEAAGIDLFNTDNDQIDAAIPEEAQDIIPDVELENILTDESAQLLDIEVSDRDEKEKDSIFQQQEIADVSQDNLEDILAVNDDDNEQSDNKETEQTDEELTDEQVADEAQSLADEMSEEQIQQNMDKQQESLSDSGGFDDQSGITATIGYKKGFSEYSKINMTDNSDWYVTKDIYKNNTTVDNKQIYLLMMGLDSRHQQIVSSQYERR
jgi:hypothetical protein